MVQFHATTICAVRRGPDDVAIGSGGNYAYAAANALFNNTEMTAAEIVEESLKIAASICVYTNDHISVERL